MLITSDAMGRRMHVLFTGLMWLFVLALLWLAFRVQAGEADAKVQAAVAKADSLRVAYDLARSNAIAVQYAAKEAGQRERKAAASLTARLSQVQDSLARSTAVLRDSSATEGQLRDALAVAIQQADTLSFQVSAYMSTVDTLRSRHAEERRAMTVALDRADTVIAHQDALIRALQKRTECRVLGLPCPSRTKLLVLGVATGVIAGALTIR